MRTYEIRCGTRVVSHVKSHTPRHAVTDYLRSLGCSDDELDPLGHDAVAWRGAVYTAVEHADQSATTSDSPQAESKD